MKKLLLVIISLISIHVYAQELVLGNKDFTINSTQSQILEKHDSFVQSKSDAAIQILLTCFLSGILYALIMKSISTHQANKTIKEDINYNKDITKKLLTSQILKEK